jgi:hypothetical protein
MNKTELIPERLQENFWLVSADMGYGHQRAIYPLKSLGRNNEIINANTSNEATKRERRQWKTMLGTYEFMSRAGKLPFIGNSITRLLDSMLYIPKYYPKKERTQPTLQVKYLKRSIEKGLCDGIVKQISNPMLPMITSFYSSAIAAEMAGHQYVFCIICDTDINRVWASENAETSKIIYFASGSISAQRLLSYGVPEKNILLTGFPLSLELLGNRDLDVLRNNLSRRLKNLDPDEQFYSLYKHSVQAFLQNGESYFTDSVTRKKSITITYAVGGAGAQKEIGKQIVESLAKKIKKGKVKINLIAGTRTEVRDYFIAVKKGYTDNNDNVRIIWANTNEAYFDAFNTCMQTTDVLWTKPSELSFYCALGIPIIMTPAIGPQEKCNKKWLREIGAGFKQKNPKHTNQWLFDMLKKGRLAEAAWSGFLKGRKYGTYNIIDFLEKGEFELNNHPLKR